MTTETAAPGADTDDTDDTWGALPRARPFVDTFRRLEGGAVLDQLADLQHEVVQAVEKLGKKGTIKIELTYKRDGRQIAVTAKTSAALPQEDPGSTLFWPSDGNLSRDNPRQEKIRFERDD